MDGWERRMSARAALRQPERDAEEAAHWRRWTAEQDRRGFALVASMTLAQAVGLMRTPPWACACIGGTACCKYRYGQAEALIRAAHIAVKLVSGMRK